ncbi:MAG: dipeptidase PepE [Gammaproteobacteria bacterium]|nr:MAG: dipeptidase PepE [Gammaproteobacteria bacterium]
MNIFMFSSGRLPTSKKLLDYGLPDIAACFEKQQVRKVVFIPYAAIRAGYDEKVDILRDSLAALPVDVKGIHEFADPVEAIRQADAIMVSGGNSWLLNKLLHDNGLIEPIRDAVLNKQAVYIGWSAGANVCSPSMCTSNDMCVVDAAITAALHFVPFNINPHYIDASIENHTGETRDERLLEFCIENPHKIVIGIPEGSWLHLDDTGLSYHCPANRPLTWFKFNRPNTTLMPGENMDFFIDNDNY